MDTWEVFFLIIFAVLIYCVFSSQGACNKDPRFTGGSKKSGFKLFGRGFDDDIQRLRQSVDNLEQSNIRSEQRQIRKFTEAKGLIEEIRRKYDCSEKQGPAIPNQGDNQPPGDGRPPSDRKPPKDPKKPGDDDDSSNPPKPGPAMMMQQSKGDKSGPQKQAQPKEEIKEQSMIDTSSKAKPKEQPAPKKEERKLGQFMDDFIIEEDRKTPDSQINQNSPQMIPSMIPQKKNTSPFDIDEIANLTKRLRYEEDDEMMQYTQGLPIPEQYQQQQYQQQPNLQQSQTNQSQPNKSQSLSVIGEEEGDGSLQNTVPEEERKSTNQSLQEKKGIIDQLQEKRKKQLEEQKSLIQSTGILGQRYDNNYQRRYGQDRYPPYRDSNSFMQSLNQNNSLIGSQDNRQQNHNPINMDLYRPSQPDTSALLMRDDGQSHLRRRNRQRDSEPVFDEDYRDITDMLLDEGNEEVKQDQASQGIQDGMPYYRRSQGQGDRVNMRSQDNRIQNILDQQRRELDFIQGHRDFLNDQIGGLNPRQRDMLASDGNGPSQAPVAQSGYLRYIQRRQQDAQRVDNQPLGPRPVINDDAFNRRTQEYDRLIRQSRRDNERVQDVLREGDQSLMNARQINGQLQRDLQDIRSRYSMQQPIQSSIQRPSMINPNNAQPLNRVGNQYSSMNQSLYEQRRRQEEEDRARWQREREDREREEQNRRRRR